VRLGQSVVVIKQIGALLKAPGATGTLLNEVWGVYYEAKYQRLVKSRIVADPEGIFIVDRVSYNLDVCHC
jgi:hypothetical protein